MNTCSVSSQQKLCLPVIPSGLLLKLSWCTCCVQMMFTCVSMVMSLTIFAYILGEISNLVMDQDAELVKTRSQVCHTEQCLYDH